MYVLIFDMGPRMLSKEADDELDTFEMHSRTMILLRSVTYVVVLGVCLLLAVCLID